MVVKKKIYVFIENKNIKISYLQFLIMLFPLKIKKKSSKILKKTFEINYTVRSTEIVIEKNLSIFIIF